MSLIKQFLPKAAVAVAVSQCMLENVCVEGKYLRKCSVMQNPTTDDGDCQWKMHNKILFSKTSLHKIFKYKFFLKNLYLKNTQIIFEKKSSRTFFASKPL